MFTTEKRKKWLLDMGQILLSLFLGNMTTLIFRDAGYLKSDLMAGIGVIGTIVLWFAYIDFLKWIAKKVPDGKKQQESEAGNKADH
jgi:phosphate starvation-inducible membrane PsiE